MNIHFRGSIRLLSAMILISAMIYLYFSFSYILSLDALAKFLSKNSACISSPSKRWLTLREYVRVFLLWMWYTLKDQTETFPDRILKKAAQMMNYNSKEK